MKNHSLKGSYFSPQFYLPCKIRTFFLFLLIFFIPLKLFAQNPSFYPGVSGQTFPQDYFSTCPEKLTADELFQLSLILSECPPESEEGKECLIIFEKIKSEVTSEEYNKMQTEEKGKAVLKLLYRDYLKKYNYAQTKINTALKEGTYNCVSSAILYMAAAKAAGLEVYGQKTTEHAFCTVYIDKKTIDVETTNPYGFNPGSKEAIENEDRIKGYYIVPKKNYVNRHQATDKVMCGLISANLASYYSNKNNFFDSIPLEALRYEIIKNEKSADSDEARKDLDTLVGNYMNLKNESNQMFMEKLNWLCDYINYWGMAPYVQKVADTHSYNYILLCYNSGDIINALDCYNKFKNMISASQISSTADLLTELELQTLTKDMQPEEKINFLYELLKNETGESENSSEIPQNYIMIPQKKLAAALENAWAGKLNALMRENSFEKGYEEAEIAISQLPQSANLKQMKNAFYNNSITIIHNNFAREYNKKNYEEARKIIEEGLKKFPADKKLNSDLKTVTQAM
ncbi:MAG: hypothetical protein PUC37_08435 [Spirochaetales bacterium]|nr:hypothetical protein [Spirochaetales bacterium]